MREKLPKHVIRKRAILERHALVLAVRSEVMLNPPAVSKHSSQRAIKGNEFLSVLRGLTRWKIMFPNSPQGLSTGSGLPSGPQLVGPGVKTCRDAISGVFGVGSEPAGSPYRGPS